MSSNYCLVLVGNLERVKAVAKRHDLTMQGKRQQISLPLQQNPAALRSVLVTAVSDGVAISVQNGDPNRRVSLVREDVSYLLGASPEKLVLLATTRYDCANRGQEADKASKAQHRRYQDEGPTSGPAKLGDYHRIPGSGRHIA